MKENWDIKQGALRLLQALDNPTFDWETGDTKDVRVEYATSSSRSPVPPRTAFPGTLVA